MGIKSMLRIAATLVLAGTAAAQPKLPQEKGLGHQPVSMFNVFCLSQLPDLGGVAKAAGFGEFAPLAGAELESYRPEGRIEEFQAWRFHDQGAEYVLTAERSAADAALKAPTPRFARATRLACTLVIPAGEATEAVLAALAKLLGRAPDKSWDEGELRVFSWSHEADKVLSQIQYFAPAKPGPKGVLRASAFVLN